jgi:hypothetical protein
LEDFNYDNDCNNDIELHDLTKESPLKKSSKTSSNLKKQLKLTNIPNYSISSKKLSSPQSEARVEINKPSSKEESRSDPYLNVRAAAVDKVIWKIKAIIDNRNFLIPIS